MGRSNNTKNTRNFNDRNRENMVTEMIRTLTLSALKAAAKNLTLLKQAREALLNRHYEMKSTQTLDTEGFDIAILS